MKEKWVELQNVNINDDKVRCKKCGAHLTNLTEFVYDNDCFSDPRYREELCKCTACGEKFILHYDLFDTEGHVYQRVFTGDVNNVNYDWQEILTEEQRKEIKEHVEKCQICQDRMNDEALSDAWFSSFLQDLRKKVGITPIRRIE